MNYGRYQVVSELGRGQMGIVYSAHDPNIDRLVALKVLRKDYADNEYFVRRFFKEAVAIGRLSHPNIVTVYDVGQDQGALYIAMEFLVGEPLCNYVGPDKLRPNQVIHVGIQVAEALDYAHRKGVIHRDIKPANIIFDGEEQVKITDFGIAHIKDVSATLQTQAGEVLGTPVYMSPEQVMGKTPDGRSDLYSLGAILYEFVSGKRPFRGKNIPSIFNAVTHDVPEAPAGLDPSVQQGFSDLIMKCLEKDPDKRFQSGAEMAQTLRSCIEDNGACVLPSSDSSPMRLKKIVYAVLCVVVIVMAGLIVARLILPIPPPAQALWVRSEPPAAEVYINDALRGKTPLKLMLEPGKYEIRLRLPEYFDWEAQVDLNQADRTEQLDVTLHPEAF